MAGGRLQSQPPLPPTLALPSPLLLPPLPPQQVPPALALHYPEYLKFMALKVHAGDVSGGTSKFSPPVFVDEMWHCHILDSVAYQKFCEALLGPGGFVHHNLAGMYDDAVVKKARLTTAMGAYSVSFAQRPPLHIWEPGGAAAAQSGAGAGSGGTRRDASTTSFVKAEAVAITGHKRPCDDGAGSAATSRFRSDGSGAAMTAAAGGGSSSNYNRGGATARASASGGCSTSGNAAAAAAPIGPNGTDVSRTQADARITLRVQSFADALIISFAVKASTKMGCVYETYARHMGVTARDLRLSLGGRRLGSDETIAESGYKEGLERLPLGSGPDCLTPPHAHAAADAPLLSQQQLAQWQQRLLLQEQMLLQQYQQQQRQLLQQQQQLLSQQQQERGAAAAPRIPQAPPAPPLVWAMGPRGPVKPAGAGPPPWRVSMTLTPRPEGLGMNIGGHGAVGGCAVLGFRQLGRGLPNPAQDAGVLPGDVLLECDDAACGTFDETLQQMRAAVAKGEPFALVVERRCAPP
ncbi:hypothetical protein JKP88DRAFT_293165 [Tribonema minus]|uniref:Ubiquitin-like domain-containing protein n=1 Tax=Tribonema minus TaxID=303371 RepID=A0A835ZKC2_9STRA|nr:hypothetical protein JKP88DRAFT_293165 [Tribonema minus]